MMEDSGVDIQDDSTVGDIPDSPNMESPENSPSPEADQTVPPPPPEAELTPPKPSELDRSIAQIKLKILDINRRFLIKERLQLGYIYEDYPRSYYRSWKAEGNEYFSLMVNLKGRLKEMEAQKSQLSRKKNENL